MSDFADVERFAREHLACGGLTPSAMPRPGGGGYLLTIACVCGATFDRWVSPEDARRPLPIPARATSAPAAAAPAAPAWPKIPAAPSVVAAPAVPAAPTIPAVPAVQTAPATAAARPAAPVSIERPSPPPAPAPSASVSWKPRPRPSEELETVVREALAAEEAVPPTAATPVAPPETPAGQAARLTPRSWPAPERLNPDPAIRGALQQQAALTPPPPPGSRGRLVWLALFMIVGLGAAAVIYVAGNPAGPLSMMATTSAPSGPAPPTNDPQRTALEGVVKSLRELHSVATSTTTVSVYSSRVTGAKSEAERYLTTSAPGATRTRVREAVDIHLLAASAWRAKSLDQRETWEAVGLDPSIDLCPPLRLVVDFTTQAESVSRPQARGAAVASALPLLWECANERIAALEETLAGR